MLQTLPVIRSIVVRPIALRPQSSGYPVHYGHNTTAQPSGIQAVKKYLPTKDQVRSQRSLRFLGDVLFENNLWHFNRNSVSYAVLVGWFCCFLPIPFQMVPGLMICIWVGANVPLAVAIIWISNPLTIPAMFYASYRLGAWILDIPSNVSTISLSWEWLSGQIGAIWQPLVLGSLVTGTTLGLISFVSVRLYWRWRVNREWARRRTRQR